MTPPRPLRKVKTLAFFGQTSPNPREYRVFLAGVKNRVTMARIHAARAINRDLINLYWDIGRGIVEKQAKRGWGESIVEMLSRDLQGEFPSMTGFSARNIWDMRRFYLAYCAPEILRQAVAVLKNQKADRHFSGTTPESILRQLVAEVPWGHHLILLGKVQSSAARIFYLRSTRHFGWSRNVLLNQIMAQTFERSQAKGKTHNFQTALPSYLAEQADEALKSSYNLEFLGVKKEVTERRFEERLVERVQRFILELGYGFCFVGRQHRLLLGSKEYYIDLLFYHRFLKALVAFELKTGPFLPEYAGKMDFYLNILNEKERAPTDNPSIGVILCAQKDDLDVEFSLKSKGNPIGVASYRLTSKLPKEFRGQLPTERQLLTVVKESMGDER
jgi:predicted nuclease of restriction endonuclease-like (RecB) superfamily